ncbi:monocarboxylate transporter 12-like [Palaemon carinicauda]|uniref:monocarboxylate transporter 12-like n=1 Tax=Palaemon carinicauda TaxID=392227 RepID=UPI0035B6AAC8
MTKSKYKVHPVDNECSLNSNGSSFNNQNDLCEDNPVTLVFQVKNDADKIIKGLNEITAKSDGGEVSQDNGGGTLQGGLPITSSQISDSEAVVPNGSLEEVNQIERPKAQCNVPDEIPRPPSAKDRGYAWVVVFNVFLINLVSAGYVKSFGITYTLIMDYFPDASGATSGWIMGLLIGCRGILAPAMGAFAVLAGPRKGVVVGGLLCVAGILLAVPAFSVLYLAFTLGAVVGIGMCMAETPGFLLVTDYFQEKRSLANGIKAAGNPMGGILFSPMIVILNQEFGLRGSFILIAGIMLQLVVLGMLMRPFELQQKIVQEDYWKKMQIENGKSDLQIRQMRATVGAEQRIKKKAIDLSFLKNPAYLVYILMVMCTAAALPSALLYAAKYGRSIGLSDLQNSAIASYIFICDVVMRLFCGFIFNRKKSNKRYGFIAGLVIGGLGCMTVPLCTNMWHLLIFATTLSLCTAFFWTLINELLADQFGGDAMSSTWGFFRMTQGICNLFYPSVIGFVMDISGGLGVPYIMMGSLLILGALIIASQPLIAKLPGSKIYLPS